MADAVVIPRRFNGPPDSGHGGYTCGVVAGLVGTASVEVTLRAPPPLERPMRAERLDGSVTVHDRETLIAEGRATELDVESPESVSLDEAEEGVRHYLEHCDAHPFPTCVACGPLRKEDGFRIFAGLVPGTDELFASTWTPDPTLADADGRVRPECVWAALDCPSASPVANANGDPPVVLARLAARLERPVTAGEPHVLTSRRLSVDGRKREAAVALFDADGERLAVARALWIELRPQR